MLSPDDRRAIEGLFDRLRDVERSGGARDPEAEDLIFQRLRRQDGAPYYMAQTILVQETALNVAEQRIAELERQIGMRNGEIEATGRGGPWDRERSGAGGFLAGAAQTALGVTGGLLLGSAVAGMLSDGVAAGDETSTVAADHETDGSDDFGDFDDGDSGFDFGGDF